MYELPKGHKGLKRPPSKPINPEFEKMRMEIDSKHKKISEVSIREYFASVAMNGFLSGTTMYIPDVNEVAKFAVEQADALIAELNKEVPPKP